MAVASALLALACAPACSPTLAATDARDERDEDDRAAEGESGSSDASDAPNGDDGDESDERDAAGAPSDGPVSDRGSTTRDGAAPAAEAGASGSPQADAAAAPAPESDAGSAGAVDAPPAPLLPAVDDPAAAGPFEVKVVATAPGLSSHMLYVPDELGKDGVKHPIVVWTNGNGASSSYYEPFLRHLASHGFFLVVDKRSTSSRETEYAEQLQGIDWATRQAEDAGGPYAGKLDAARIAIMGHSMGSLASFVNGGDTRVRTSIHWSGGLVGNPTGTDEGALQKLHAPAAFLCGGADAQAGPACANDFRDAPADLPVFYGTLAGVGHLGVFGDRNGGEYGRVGLAWLRWQLAGDESFRSYFVGEACAACMRPWSGMSRNLD